jgi:hypothetical protein
MIVVTEDTLTPSRRYVRGLRPAARPGVQ